MGQSPSTHASSSTSSSSSSSSSSTAARHDNASTRTLHSTSMSSNRGNSHRTSFFRRISNRLTPNASRRFGRSSTAARTEANTYSNARIIHTSASSTTSSVRRATQEAARAAAAVTGPPIASSGNSIRSTAAESSVTSFWNDLLAASPVQQLRDSNNHGNNGILRYLQLPLRVQQEINATLNSAAAASTESPNSGNNNETASATTTNRLQSSSASSRTTSTTNTANTTTRRMHILVIEYRANNTTDDNTATAAPPTPTPTPMTPPRYRFLGLSRPRSQVSTTSSTDTIQSMPVSMTSNTTQRDGGQWVVYVLTNPALQALSSTLLEEGNYEDLLWLTNMLGPVRPTTTTQQAVDEAIPVIDWSDDTKQQLKDDACLVCLDEFALKQPVRILKCSHVFHRECVDRWLCEAHNSCPVCRGVPC